MRDEASGDLSFGWIRQTRIGGDGWDQVEVPLGETGEAYAVSVFDGATLVRIISVTAPSATYPPPTRRPTLATCPPTFLSPSAR